MKRAAIETPEPRRPHESLREANQRRATEYARQRAVRVDTLPTALVMFRDDVCNATCLFCAGHHPGRKGSQLKADPAVTDYLWEHVVPHVTKLDFTSDNEVLLDEGVLALLEDDEPDSKLFLVSNGLLLKRRLERLLATRRRLALGVSLHAATPETHSTLFGCSPKKFDEVVGALRTLVERRDAENLPISLRLIFVAMKANMNELADFIRLAGEIGADAIEIKRLSWGWQWRTRRNGYDFDYEQEVTFRHLDVIEEQIERGKQYLREMGFDLRRLEVIHDRAPNRVARLVVPSVAKALQSLLWRIPQAPEVMPYGLRAVLFVSTWVGAAKMQLLSWTRPRSKGCDRAWRFAVVDAFGNVRPCFGTMYSVGNLRRSSFEEVWNSWRMRLFRRTIASGRAPSVCGRCARLTETRRDGEGNVAVTYHD